MISSHRASAIPISPSLAWPHICRVRRILANTGPICATGWNRSVCCRTLICWPQVRRARGCKSQTMCLPPPRWTGLNSSTPISLAFRRKKLRFLIRNIVSSLRLHGKRWKTQVIRRRILPVPSGCTQAAGWAAISISTSVPTLIWWNKPACSCCVTPATTKIFWPPGSAISLI